MIPKIMAIACALIATQTVTAVCWLTTGSPALGIMVGCVFGILFGMAIGVLFDFDIFGEGAKQ